MNQQKLEDFLLICPKTPVMPKTMRLVIHKWKSNIADLFKYSDQEMLEYFLDERVLVPVEDKISLNPDHTKSFSDK